MVDKINISKDPWNKVKGFGQKNGVEATISLNDFEYF
jgi:hypothetical protein